MLKLHIPVCTETRICLSGDDCCKIVTLFGKSRLNENSVEAFFR